MFPPLRHRALAALRAFVLLEDPELEARVAGVAPSSDGTAPGRRAAVAAHRAPLATRRAPRLPRRHGAVTPGPARCTSPVGRPASVAAGTRSRTTAS